MCKHCWDDDKVAVHHKDFIRGWSDDGYEDTPHRKAGKPKKRKRVPGCPENEGKAHVYVWVTYDSIWLTDYEIKVCCGCGKRASGRKGFRRKV